LIETNIIVVFCPCINSFSWVGLHGTVNSFNPPRSKARSNNDPLATLSCFLVLDNLVVLALTEPLLLEEYQLTFTPAGFYPTTVSYISLFYTRFEFGRRLSFFYGQLAMAGGIGGILAYFIFSYYPADSSSAWKPWQILFIIEGLATMVLAVIGFLWLPDDARTAWFLTPSERRWAEERVKRDRGITAPSGQSKPDEETLANEDGLEGRASSEEAHDHLLSSSSAYPYSSSGPTSKALVSSQGLTRTDIISAILDWKIWFLLVCNILSAIPVTAFSVFLPLVLKPLTAPSHVEPSTQSEAENPGFVNLLSAPPFLLGAITLYFFSTYSDRNRIRLRPILVGLCMIVGGLVFMIFLPKTWVILRYLSLCVLLSGSFIPSPLTVAWMSGNIPAPGKRTLVFGINGWGNLAGAISAAIFEPKYAKEGYRTSLIWTLIAAIAAAVCFALFRMLLVSENNTRETWSRKVGAREVDIEHKSGTGTWTGRGVLGWKVDSFPILKSVDRWAGEQRKEDGFHGRVGDERFTYQFGL